MGVTLLGEPWVLYRSGGGVVAFADRCPHRHCPLTLGHCEGGVLQCAYHGWRFDRRVGVWRFPPWVPTPTVPPTAQLAAAAAVTETHGMVFLAPDEPMAPLGTMPEADDPSFMVGRAAHLAGPGRRRACWPTTSSTWRTSRSCTPGPSAPTRRPRCRPTPWPATTGPSPSATSTSSPTARTPGWPPACGRSSRRRRLTYQLCAPFHLRLRIDFLDSGGSNVIGFFIQPETAETLPAVHHAVAGRPRGRPAAHGGGGRVRSRRAARGPAGPGGLPRAGPAARSPGRGAHAGRPHDVGAAPGPGRPGRRWPSG